jgi:ketosteroid isomerase-like protein
MIDTDEWLAAWNTRDPDRIAALCQPEVEVTAVTLSAEPRRYSGLDGVRQWVNEVRERFQAETRFESIQPIDEGAAIMSGTLFIDSDTSGDVAEQPFAILVHLRDDRATWIGTFITPQAAREAYDLGVTGPRAG